ncbi:MAG: hypothetical protein KJI69_05720 [Patescibacteria group bacterium]|nr:hypothetical protein [Patescibacteria group bacterium]
MSFIIEWLIFYVAIMFTMSVDNIFWISASPEYPQFKKAGWFKCNKNFIMMNQGNHHRYDTKIEYIFIYRVKTVLTHWRDIVPAIITSFILVVIPW